MEITYKGYRLTPNTIAVGKWDLEKMTTRKNKKTGEKYKDFSLIGYAFTLENAKKRIAMIETQRTPGTFSIKEAQKIYDKNLKSVEKSIETT